MSYLDGNGLATLWAKIKQYVRDNATSSIPDLSVVTSKIAAGAITADKLSSDIFVLETKLLLNNQTISPNTGYYYYEDITKAGYKVFALGGFTMTGTNARSCIPEEINLFYDRQLLSCYIFNKNTSANAVIKLYVNVVYMKV